MGKYLNAGNENFRRIRQGTYVDKTSLISEVNRRIGTMENFVCQPAPAFRKVLCGTGSPRLL